MSSFIIVGFFALANGHRAHSAQPGSSKTVSHCHYMTIVQCLHGPEVDAKIHVFSPASEAIVHPNDTVAFVIAHASVQQHPFQILMEAKHLIPMPGNPEDNDYNERMPNFPYPFIAAIGHVTNTHHAMQGEDAKTQINLSVSDYVHGSIQASTIQLVMSFHYEHLQFSLPYQIFF